MSPHTDPSRPSLWELSGLYTRGRAEQIDLTGWEQALIREAFDAGYRAGLAEQADPATINDRGGLGLPYWQRSHPWPPPLYEDTEDTPGTVSSTGEGDDEH